MKLEFVLGSDNICWLLDQWELFTIYDANIELAVTTKPYKQYWQWGHFKHGNNVKMK